MHPTLCHAIDALSSCDRGFHFYSGNAPPEAIDFLGLRQIVRSKAAKLRTLSDRPSEPIIIVSADQFQFIQALLAVIRAGFTAVPVSPPSLIGDIKHYQTELDRIRKITGARFILSDDCLHGLLQSTVSSAQLLSLSDCNSIKEYAALPEASASDPALIQFTSGSTGSPKGVEISHANLVSNARAITQALAIDATTDKGFSWLPLHHDMGLIGFVVTPLLTQTSSGFLSPLEFARHPRRWLELMSQTKATISYAPNFAYHLVARALKNQRCGHWDLSAWRAAGCGGEPISQEVLEQFATPLSTAGFNPMCFTPSYGLAEATVAVTISPPGSGIKTRFTGNIINKPTPMISSGSPVGDTEVRVVSADGTRVQHGQEGEIQARGAGVATRLWTETGIRNATDANGWLSTGDRGILVDKELYVCGRIKESIVINGVNYYPNDIETAVKSLSGIRSGQVVAFGRPGPASEELVLVAESNRDGAPDRLPQDVRRTIRQQLGLSVAEVIIVDRGTIRRTTSGKIQRQALKQCYLAGDLVMKNSTAFQ